MKWDRTQTFRKGAAKAPDLIRKIFPKLENYINGVDLSEHFFDDMGNVNGRNINEVWNGIYKKLFDYGSFPIITGGDHLVTFGSVKALKPDYYVCLDAHPDFESSNMHDSVNRRVAEFLGNNRVFLYGVRCMSKKENEYIVENRISVNNLKEIRKLRGRIYLSVDLDVLDPSILPAVGNPEPDGLSFRNVVEVVSKISDRLVGMDFVEYTPLVSTLRDVHSTIVGKLIYFSMAEIVKKKTL